MDSNGGIGHPHGISTDGEHGRVVSLHKRPPAVGRCWARRMVILELFGRSGTSTFADALTLSSLFFAAHLQRLLQRAVTGQRTVSGLSMTWASSNSNFKLPISIFPRKEIVVKSQTWQQLTRQQNMLSCELYSKRRLAVMLT